MTPNEIAARTGLPPRRIRYVLEHEVLPGSRQRAAGYGQEWSFTDVEAFGIALAAFLLDIGLRREVVAAFFREVVGKFRGPTKSQDIPLYRAFFGKPSRLTIVDGRYLRLVAARQKGIPGGDVDTGWIVLSSGPGEPPANPVVKVEVDLDALKSLLRD